MAALRVGFGGGVIVHRRRLEIFARLLGQFLRKYPIMMQKYIIFPIIVPIMTESCYYTGFMSNKPLFSRKS